MARAIHSFAFRLVVAILAGGAIGGFLGFAAAQDRSAGALDTQCAAECTSHGYAAEYCNQVCWIPDPNMAARGSSIDWKCMTDCRAADGREEDCLKRCKRR
jgi:hypothetical protein